MRKWFIIILAISNVAYPSDLSWYFRMMLGRMPCAREVLTGLYDSGAVRSDFTQQQFIAFASRMHLNFGLPRNEVRKRYEALAAHPELLELMAGRDLPVAAVGNELHVSAAWGADYNLLPNLEHWNNVHNNFQPLADRLGKKLHLDSVLVHQLFGTDNASIGDSGWVLASTKSSRGQTDASVKITFFDYTDTPDGAWPRFYYESPLGGPHFAFHRCPREIPPDFPVGYCVKTSLDHWGLFPAELENEHEGFLYEEHRKLFSREYNLIHRSMMMTLMDQFGTPAAEKAFQDLMEFRKQVPQAAREMAELQRFNIPPDADPASKAQIFYGLSVLLTLRPIKTVVALSPRPLPDDGSVPPRPSWQIVNVAPGWEFLADIARAVGEEMDREQGIDLTPLPDPKHDPLRDMYEGLGLEVIKTFPYTPGLANGSHVYRGPRDRFVRRIIAYQEKHPQFLTTNQLRVIAEIKKGLSDEE